MINAGLRYQPKGGMCASCVRQYANCSHFIFKDMRAISKGDEDGVVIVRCTGYSKPDDLEAHRESVRKLVQGSPDISDGIQAIIKHLAQEDEGPKVSLQHMTGGGGGSSN